MPVALHQTRWWEWCMPDNERKEKEINQFFIDENQYKVSTKVNLLIVLNNAMAWDDIMFHSIQIFSTEQKKLLHIKIKIKTKKATIIYKMFETNSTFHAKKRTVANV